MSTSSKGHYETVPQHEDDNDAISGKEGEKGKVAPNAALRPWARENAAIMMSYFSIGIALTFLTTPLTYYMIETLDASAAQQNVVWTVQSLPWSFKILYGFLSDCRPIMGMRRKPYFVMGWIAYMICNFVLAALGTPSVEWIVGLVFLQCVGFMMSDVMSDAMIVERSKLFEGAQDAGTMQATGYTVRTFGTVVGAVGGTLLYNKEAWGWGLSMSQIFFVNGLVPMCLLGPYMWPLREIAPKCGHEPRGVSQQVNDIWQMVQLRAVWQPCCFVFVYNLLQLGNPAWSSFLIIGLDFSNEQIGLISIASACFSYAGILTYRRFLMTSSWRNVYLWTSGVVFLFSILQLSLIFRINERLGISNVFFAAGDTAIQSYVLYIQFLPVCIMYIQMCPDGAEGASYAMLTTLQNMASTVANDISTLLAGIWNVSNGAIEKGDYTGMWKLTVLTSVIELVPLVLLPLLPANREDQKKLQASDERSKLGGALFIGVLVVSLVATVVETLAEVY